MAIGFTASNLTVTTVVAALCLPAWAAGAPAAKTVSVSGTLGDKALISVNGAPAKVVATGGQLDGVRVVAVQGDRVTIELEGQRRTLSVGLGDSLTARRPAPDGMQEVVGRASLVLTADTRGQFSAQVAVNGVSAPFLVDTGASVVTLPDSLARRAGIDLERATPVTISTANGRARAYRVVLNSVKVGSLAAHLVEAVVVEDAKLPFALLGMSFLNRMDMRREGDSLTLLQRY
jgi:aspartyl protease family protein